MIARLDAPNALLVRRTAENGTTCFPRMVDAVKQALADAVHQSEVLFALSNSTKVLFSEKVVLAEGKTEQTLLPDLFHHEAGCSLEEDRFGLVALGSSSDVPSALAVLAAMGIPTKAVVDLDFAFRPAVQHGLIPHDNAAVLGCKAVLARLQQEQKIALDQEGLPQKMGQVSAAMAFALMAGEQDAHAHIEALHAHFLALGIWVWKKGTIETHLGLTAKTPAAHLAFLTGYPNEQFRQGLPAYGDVQAMMAWLRV